MGKMLCGPLAKVGSKAEQCPCILVKEKNKNSCHCIKANMKSVTHSAEKIIIIIIIITLTKQT